MPAVSGTKRTRNGTRQVRFKRSSLFDASPFSCEEFPPTPGPFWPDRMSFAVTPEPSVCPAILILGLDLGRQYMIGGSLWRFLMIQVKLIALSLFLAFFSVASRAEELKWGDLWLNTFLTPRNGKVFEGFRIDLRTMARGNAKLRFEVRPNVSRFQTGLPGWLKLSSDGQLSGTPGLGAEGDYEFVLRATTSTEKQDATISFSVQPNATMPSGVICLNGENGSEVGLTPDKKFILFACPNH
jgi:hypothetical protein